MRRDRVPRVLRRDRLGHGPSGDIADRYTHIDDEMIEDMLTALTRRWQAAVVRRARIDQARGGEPRSGVPALDEWLGLFRERGSNPAPICAPIGRESRRAVKSFAWWAQLGSNQRPLACKARYPGGWTPPDVA